MNGPGFYLLSNPTDVADETAVLTNVLDTLPEVVVHLRKPYATVFEVGQILKEIPREFHSRIVVHYYSELLETFGLKGWHYSPKFPRGEENAAVSSSVHSLEELRNKAAGYQYLFCSPVLDSLSKPGYTGGTWNIAAETPALKKKAVALGGITPETVALAQKAGFFNFAVLGYVWQSDNPVRAALRMSKLLANED